MHVKRGEGGEREKREIMRACRAAGKKGGGGGGGSCAHASREGVGEHAPWIA